MSPEMRAPAGVTACGSTGITARRRIARGISKGLSRAKKGRLAERLQNRRCFKTASLQHVWRVEFLQRHQDERGACWELRPDRDWECTGHHAVDPKPTLSSAAHAGSCPEPSSSLGSSECSSAVSRSVLNCSLTLAVVPPWSPARGAAGGEDLPPKPEPKTGGSRATMERTLFADPNHSLLFFPSLVQAPLNFSSSFHCTRCSASRPHPNLEIDFPKRPASRHGGAAQKQEAMRAARRRRRSDPRGGA